MQKTKKFRRLLAGLLAVLMLSICIPAAAFAEGEDRSLLPTITIERVVDNDSDVQFDNLKTKTVWGAGLKASLDCVDVYKGVDKSAYVFSGWTYQNGDEIGKFDWVHRDVTVVAHFDAVSTTKEIGLNFWDIKNNVQAGEGKMTVDASATTVDASAITAPEGFTVVSTGTLNIADGWVYVEVEPVDGMKTVGLNYYDEVNGVQVCEKELAVDADAIHVNTNDIPALDGYEFIVTGDLQINDGWVYVGVKPLETKTVGLNFFDEENYEQVCEVEVEVPYNAIHLNTSEISKYLPEGYELIELGDLSIRDGWIYVGVKCNWTLKIYWAIDNEQASFANGNDNAWTQELTWMHADDEMAMPEINVNDGYKLNGWSVSGESGEFWTADLASVKELSKKCVKDENGGYISITANVVKADEATSGNTNTVTASSDDSSDEVVKAEAPADNSTKILPQTGNQGVVSPVSFVVVLCAALAGAAVYLFAIRKKLN